MAANTHPPTTRQTVTPISPRKPNRVRRSHPSCSMVIGSARNVFDTKPPSVAKAQARRRARKTKCRGAYACPEDRLERTGHRSGVTSAKACCARAALSRRKRKRSRFSRTGTTRAPRPLPRSARLLAGSLNERVSTIVLMSGFCLMMPISSSRSAASLEKVSNSLRRISCSPRGPASAGTWPSCRTALRSASRRRP